MFIANDICGNRIDILNADLDRKYYCPVCNQELIQRRGEINVPHFAHKKNSYELCDSWHYDMTEWHRNWQLLYPEENREVVVEYDGKKHRADILINNTVIEFQHSKLSPEEFNERNSFYKAAGYNIIWLFDMIEDRSTKRIQLDWCSNSSFEWKYHWHTFDGFYPEQAEGIYVCFQFSSDLSDGDYGIEHLVWMSNDKKHFRTEDGIGYDRIEFIEFSSDYKETNNEHEEGKSIIELLLNSGANVIGVVNIKTGVCAKVGNPDFYRNNAFNKVLGYLGRKDGENGYYKDRREIYYWYKPEWKIVWQH